MWHRVAVSRPSDGELSEDCTLIADGDMGTLKKLDLLMRVARHLTERQFCLLEVINNVIRSVFLPLSLSSTFDQDLEIRTG